MKILRAVLFLALCLPAFKTARSIEQKIGGKGVHDVFTDRNLAALAAAACDGDQGAVERGVKNGANPNAVGVYGATPLLWAIGCKNANGVEALLRAGADPNFAAGGRFNAVYAAATLYDPTILRLALKYLGDPNARDSRSNKSALEEALLLGVNGAGWENYYALLDAGADPNRADELGDTIAKAAAAYGRFDKVMELLERGYTFDLEDLGRAVQTREVAQGSDQSKWQEKVKARLELDGVRFPVPPKVRR
jgi:hypothetical protein